MKLFVLLSRVPYPIEKGDKLRAFHQIRCLAAQHEIVLCALSDKPIHPDAIKVLEAYCRQVHIIRLRKAGMIWNVLKAFISGKPLQVGYFYRCKARRQIENLIETTKPDHIFCQLIRVAEYMKNVSVPKTLDYQDIFSMGMKRRSDTSPFWKKPVFLLEYKRLLRYEHYVFDRFDNKTIISQPDRDLIPHPQKHQITIIPNGVDQAYFAPFESEMKYDVVFTGNMAYPPNVDAACFLVQEILPHVLKDFPKAKFLVAGASPHFKVQALAGSNVVVSGWMPDIRVAYAQSRIFIAPMRIGTGLQNKLLEAMSMGLPSITTPLANQALGASNGTQILCGENAAELAGHIIRLLKEPTLAQTIASQGHQFVKAVFNWEQTASQLTDIMLHTRN